MNLYSVWPLVGLLILIFGLAATPLLKFADTPPIPTANRIKTLDGTRGFLALSVFFHHGAVYHDYIQGRPWGSPPDRLYALLGPFGVAIFFMITGFLFWSQVTDKGGKPDWVKLYVGRVFRIGPLYVLAASTMILAALALTGFRLHESIAHVGVELAKWLLLGVTTGGNINGFIQTGDLVANVTWTLRYEWLFYASLIITSLFARNRHAAWIFPLMTLALSLAALFFTHNRLREAVFVALFSIGMITAAVRPAVKSINFDKISFSIVATLLLMVVLTTFSTAYAVLQVVLLGAAFFFIANGASLFGLLNSKPARRLGDISFGIYLLQGLILASAFSLPHARAIALASAWGHWAVVGFAGLLLVCVATAAHVLVERPGVDAGRNLLSRWRSSATST